MGCTRSGSRAVEEEALRDLVRAREDVRGDLMRARQRLAKLLLRHDVRLRGHREHTGRSATARGSRRSATSVRGAQATLLDYLGAIDTLELRRDQLEATIAELVPGSPWAQTVARLRCLRGIDTLSAVGLCAEIGDFDALRAPGRLMSYLGLVPSENSSGQTRRQGSITKTGLPARPPAAGRGRLALPQDTRPRHDRSSAAKKASRNDHRDLLAGATTAAPRLAPPRRPARQAPHDRRGRRRPRARRVLLGARARRLTPAARRHVGRGGGGTWHTRESIRDLSYEQPPGPRSILDSRALTTKPGPAAVANPRTRVSESDRASRTRPARRPPTDTMPATAAGIRR